MVLEFIPGLSSSLLNRVLFGNTIENYVIAGILFFVVSFGGKLMETIVVARLKKLARRTKSSIDDIVVEALENLNWVFYGVVGIYVALLFLSFSELIDRILGYVVMVIVTIYAVRAIMIVVDHTLKKIMRKKETQSESLNRFITGFTKGTIWIIAILLVLSNLGYDVTSLIAGLGIGGLAIALALQKIFEDIFASLSIFFDKPFEEGDFIILDGLMGTVKHIGIKTTRLQSLQGQEIIISNTDLASARVNNYKRMEKRRIVFSFGVTYQTPNKKMKKILDIVKTIFDDLKEVDLDRVHFKEFADSSLNYEVVYYVSNSDYAIYMNAQQEINFKLKEAFEKEKIEFAYPTQTIFLEK
jgi:small-conductance mechanosensitive channel